MKTVGRFLLLYDSISCPYWDPWSEAWSERPEMTLGIQRL
jgi:hypothetical protein